MRLHRSAISFSSVTNSRYPFAGDGEAEARRVALRIVQLGAQDRQRCGSVVAKAALEQLAHAHTRRRAAAGVTEWAVSSIPAQQVLFESASDRKDQQHDHHDQ